MLKQKGKAMPCQTSTRNVGAKSLKVFTALCIIMNTNDYKITGIELGIKNTLW